MILSVAADYQQGGPALPAAPADDTCSVFVSSKWVVHAGEKHPQEIPSEMGLAPLAGVLPGQRIDLKHLVCLSDVMSRWEVSGSSEGTRQV